MSERTMTASEVIDALGHIDATALVFISLNAEMVPICKLIINQMMAVFVPNEDAAGAVVEVAIAQSKEER